jgi:hypothetical protein
LERNKKADFLFTQFRNYSTYSTRLSLSFFLLEKITTKEPIFLQEKINKNEIPQNVEKEFEQLIKMYK